MIIGSTRPAGRDFSCPHEKSRFPFVVRRDLRDLCLQGKSGGDKREKLKVVCILILKVKIKF